MTLILRHTSSCFRFLRRFPGDTLFLRQVPFFLSVMDIGDLMHLNLANVRIFNSGDFLSCCPEIL